MGASRLWNNDINSHMHSSTRVDHTDGSSSVVDQELRCHVVTLRSWLANWPRLDVGQDEPLLHELHVPSLQSSLTPAGSLRPHADGVPVCSAWLDPQIRLRECRGWVKAWHLREPTSPPFPAPSDFNSTPTSCMTTRTSDPGHLTDTVHLYESSWRYQSWIIRATMRRRCLLLSIEPS